MIFKYNNLILDFYNIVLSESVRYDRITGFFNSTSLAVAARGLINLINNGGHMRLLCGTSFDEEDMNAIINAEQLKNYIDKKFKEDLDNIHDKFIDNHVEILGWMVANDLLEIKIGVKKNTKGYNNSGILHSKIGILYDEEDNVITFDGSVNETASGWIHNIESLKVFKSWEDLKFMSEDIYDFENYWNGNVDSLEILDIPEASKKHLINKAPKDLSTIKNILNKLKPSENYNKHLFKHQKEAMDFWFDNSNNCIFEMATGTGKTFTALKSVQKLLTDNKNILTVIASPQSDITQQWTKELNNLNFANCYEFYSSANDNWYRDMSKFIMRLRLDVKFDKPNIICTTHQTFSKTKFIELIKKVNCKKCIIVDEMHHVGSSEYSKGLLDDYTYRLGLSATPSRYMDENGTRCLLNYFNNTSFKFDLSDALREINEVTGKTFLTPYHYYPRKIELNPNEYEKYNKLGKQIAILMNSKKDESDNLKSLIRERRSIINNAENKYEVLEDILDEIEDKNHLIVFCSNKQIKKVLKILKKHDFYPRHRFTQNESTKKDKRLGGLSERQKILYNFDIGDYKAIVAIKCLDEGVDVPSADKVIIMSSSTNPIEYVQRRGRVLRRYKNKEYANIYDLTVVPEDMSYNSLIKNETKRLRDFIDTADNKFECYDLLNKWGLLYG